MLSLLNTTLSQNSPQMLPKMVSKALMVPLTRVFLTIGMLLSSLAIVSTAEAGLRKLETYKVQLDELSTLKEPSLDWRNPRLDVNFELPTSDWVEDVELFINIHAEQKPNKYLPLLVHFNGADPLPIYPQGESFQARIKLDRSHVRSHGNTVGISFDKPTGCVAMKDGSWDIDLSDSFLVLKAHTPSTLFHIRQVKNRLQSPLSAPKTVAIKAKGANRYRLEMLASQGTALNMNDTPRFTLSNSPADLEIVIGTRRDIASEIKGTELAEFTGPTIGITRNKPVRMILTADDETSLLELAKEFASYELPATRKSYVVGGSLQWQTPFSTLRAPVIGKKPISELGPTGFDRGWGNSAKSFSFNIDNPLTAEGRLQLQLMAGPDVDPSSDVSITLNGSHLEDVKLARKTNTKEIFLPRGLLKGMDNELIIAPELTPKKQSRDCAAAAPHPGFVVGKKSHLRIKTDISGPAADLTRFAASGYPFSNQNGAQTDIILNTSRASDRAAAMRVMAQLARSHGTGWTETEVYTLKTVNADTKRHKLFIGPNLNATAPRGLSAAVEGRKRAPKVIQTAELDITPISLLSVRPSVRGGIVALYENPQSDSHLQAYITSVRGHNFSRTMDNLLRGDHWNKLEGSMARWNRNTVEMGRTAFNINIQEVAPVKSMPKFDLAAFEMPDFAIPEIDLDPLKERLAAASTQTLIGINRLWDSAANKVTSRFSQPKPTPAQPQYQPPTTMASSGPTIRLKPTPAQKPYVSYASQKTSQYKPVTRASRIGNDLQNTTQSSLRSVGEWIDGFMSRSRNLVSGGSTAQGESNILTYAILASLLLLLIGLASPKAKN